MPQSAWSIKMDAKVSTKTMTKMNQKFFRYMSFYSQNKMRSKFWDSLFQKAKKQAIYL